MRQLTVDNDSRIARTQNRPPVAWIWAGIVSMIVIVAAVIFWTFNLAPTQLGEGLSTSIPDVVGQSFDDGAAALEGADLVAQKFTETSTTVPEGAIIRTDPEAGTNVTPGFQVKVFVSLGETPAQVPNVNNLLEADAIAQIEARGLQYGSTTQEYSPDLAAGIVIRSDPEGDAERRGDGSIIRQGDVVNLYVSNGLVDVPDVTGQALAQANSTLTALKLSITTNVDFSCSGNVVSAQSIVGEQAQRAAITIQVCGGS
jgi:serine/threonine-protein kinase